LQDSRKEMLDRVQRRAEEYEYLTHSCSKGSALALMEEFGLGNWAIIRAMSAFPGFGMTKGICRGDTIQPRSELTHLKNKLRDRIHQLGPHLCPV
jgi:hypothetical protein